MVQGLGRDSILLETWTPEFQEYTSSSTCGRSIKDKDLPMEIRRVIISRNRLFFYKQLRELTSSNYIISQPPTLNIKLRNSQHKPAANIMMALEIRHVFINMAFIHSN